MTQPYTTIVRLSTVTFAANKKFAPVLRPEPVLMPMIPPWPRSPLTL